MMGSPESDPNRRHEEKLHRVRITKPFYIGKCEVTRGEFARFVAATKYKTEAEKYGLDSRAILAIRGGRSRRGLSSCGTIQAWKLDVFTCISRSDVAEVKRCLTGFDSGRCWLLL